MPLHILKKFVSTSAYTKRKGKSGRAVIVTSAIASAVGYSVYTIVYKVPAFQHISYGSKEPTAAPLYEPYIYLEGKDSGSVTEQKRQTLPKNYKTKDQTESLKWFSWLRAKSSSNPRTLAKLCKSSVRQVRFTAIESLARKDDWTDAECCLVAQAIDFRAAIGLARYPDTDLRFFLVPPPLPTLQEDSTNEIMLRKLLYSLPTEGLDLCTKHFTSKALSEGNRHSRDEASPSFDLSPGGAWCFGGVGLAFAESFIPQESERVEIFCLQALASHSMLPVNCAHIISADGLQLMQRIYVKRKDNIKIRRLILRILANLSVHKELHEDICRSGWIGIMASCLQSKDLSLSTHACRALINLDRDFCKQMKLEDGVFVFHPQHRTRLPVCADVVFVHGLRGGAFHTWRQQDPSLLGESPSYPEIKERRKLLKEFTYCWPKDWLAKHYPCLRILTVEYDTYLSQWSSICPYEDKKRLIKARSSEILTKLKKADIGSRPVIFVGHSMGGLLIKKMLCNDASDPVAEQTRGCIFYSTPHKGSSLAASSTQAKYLLYPSVEVQEIRKDSKELIKLNDDFGQLAIKKNIKCLSIGESEKTVIGLKVKLLIVPQDSSNPGYGEFVAVETNHQNVCKPKNKESVVYQKVVEFLACCLAEEDGDIICNESKDDWL